MQTEHDAVRGLSEEEVTVLVTLLSACYGIWRLQNDGHAVVSRSGAAVDDNLTTRVPTTHVSECCPDFIE